MTSRDDQVVVLGGGILGCLTALQCARRGIGVVLVDQEASLWSRASLANEGKVHLGLVYALGSAETQQSMLRDAVRFGPLVDEAFGEPVDWPRISTEGFAYIVMPESARTAPQLALTYQSINDDYLGLGRPAYLGEHLESVVDLDPTTDEASGLLSFHTFERAVDPITLRALALAAISRRPEITVRCATTATSIESKGDHALTTVRGAEGESTVRSMCVIDCRWESQGMGVAGYRAPRRNIRVKAAVRAQTAHPVITATLVAGPFGDIVQHRDYVYLSWYPAARLHHEFTPAASGAAHDALAGAASTDVINAQLRALAQHRWIPDDITAIEGTGGFIVGEGPTDIDDPHSELHNRAASRVLRHDRVILPLSLKFTSAPVAASTAAELAHEIVRDR
ncbi:MAG: hypothetical protein C0444_00575 [Microbacterium sp.]|nr:hypothetical protein [Microbacterium sp.]MBA4346881.1 hypothetical protein [Microbacterium sp.]